MWAAVSPVPVQMWHDGAAFAQGASGRMRLSFSDPTVAVRSIRSLSRSSTTAPDAAPCAAPKLDAEHRAMARALFERFDTDHDGRVSQSELRDGLRSMGMDLDDGTFDSLWRKMTPEG